MIDFRILVVDDEPIICEVLKSLLEGEGYTVETVNSLAEARKKRPTRRFELVLTDKNLPDGSGLELAEEIVADVSSKCEVVLITGYASLDSAVESFRLGIADYLTKPFDNATVLARVHRIAEASRLRSENETLMMALREKNRVLEELTARDPLTELYNHRYLQDFMEQEAGRRNRESPFAFVLLGIDHFKEYNAEHGHTVGDQLLKCVADILRSQPGALVAARYSGDEFALVLEETSKRHAAASAQVIRRRLYSKALSTGLPEHTVSIGVAGFPEDGNVIEAAVYTLEAAKQGGRDRVLGFTESLRADEQQRRAAAEEEHQRVAALDASIEERAFNMAFQPIVASADGRIFGYEALVRPKHEMFPSPWHLFQTAERAGRIHPLSGVLRQMAAEFLPDLAEPMAMFINVHPVDLTDELITWGEELGDATRRIVLEVTETEAVADFAHVAKLLGRLQAQGFRVAVDDLGSGYAGLNSLARLGPNIVKLDMELLRDIQTDPRRERLVKAILDFVNGEDMLVVAEGIETKGERDTVVSVGCHLMQGYLFARPAPPFCEVKIED